MGTKRFGGYELRERLGVGGMAEVYLAYRQGGSSRRPVVIKRMLPHLAEDQHYVAMFRDEARIASAVDDEGVCRVFELGECDGQPFIVMEYLRGVSLVDIMRKHAQQRRAVDMRLSAALIMGAAEGLQAVHRVPIIHRDISLSNVFVTVNGVVKILDFGIAKSSFQTERTRAGAVKGKYSFMSPEQLLGRPLDTRSDLFSLGTLAFILFTGQHPFKHNQEYETIKAVVQYPLPDPMVHRFDLPTPIADVILRAHQRVPEDRFASAAQMRDALAVAARSLGPTMTRAEVGAEIRRLFAEELRESRQRLKEPRRNRMPAASSPPAPRGAEPDLVAHLSRYVKPQGELPPLVPPLVVADHTPSEPAERLPLEDLEVPSVEVVPPRIDPMEAVRSAPSVWVQLTYYALLAALVAAMAIALAGDTAG